MTKNVASDGNCVPPAERRAEFALLARQARGGLVSPADAQRVWNTSPTVTAARLSRYQRRGWLRRVRRGLYLVLPLEADPRGAVTVEDPWLLAKELFAPCYIGGWSAAEHWELTEQIFRSVFVVSSANVRSRAVPVVGVEFRVGRTTAQHVGLADSVWRGREKVLVSGRELTLADGLVNPSWLGGTQHLADVLFAYRESERWQPKKLLERVGEQGSGAAFKRLGWLASQLFPEESELIAACMEHRTAGLVAVDPGVKDRGHINRRWGLRINVEIGAKGTTG
jgi:predicted transcriptional regulator of viral defense system